MKTDLSHKASDGDMEALRSAANHINRNSRRIPKHHNTGQRRLSSIRQKLPLFEPKFLKSQNLGQGELRLQQPTNINLGFLHEDDHLMLL
jgi:hypothetical protein